MKKKYLFTVLIAASVMIAGSSFASEKSTVDLGKKLFNDRALGGSTNDTSCTTCHKDGKGLENASKNQKISKIINQCITGPLKGSKIDGRSVEMRSLKMYIETFNK